MKIACFSVLALFTAPTLFSQTISPAEFKDAKIGQPITLQLVGGVAADDIIDWRVFSGRGKLDVSEDRMKASLTPAPSENSNTIVVRCTIAPAHGDRKVAQAVITLAASQPEPAIDVKPAEDKDHVPPPKAQQQPQQAPQPLRPPPLQPIDTDIQQLGFVPAGFMGSAEKGKTIVLNQGSADPPLHAEHVSTKIAYTPETAQETPWVAIAWQYLHGGSVPNWGENPGLNLEAGASDTRFRSLRMWARGALTAGMPPVVQFKSGGGTQPNAPNHASYEVTGSFRPLTTTWTEYCLDLTGRNLSSVVSALTVVMERAGNPSGAVVYLSDIHYSPQACAAH